MDIHVAPATSIDPVCGMVVGSAAAEHRYESGGVSFFFCSAGCRSKFIADPNAYAQPTFAGIATAIPSAADGAIVGGGRATAGRHDDSDRRTSPPVRACETSTVIVVPKTSIGRSIVRGMKKVEAIVESAAIEANIISLLSTATVAKKPILRRLGS